MNKAAILPVAMRIFGAMQRACIYIWGGQLLKYRLVAALIAASGGPPLALNSARESTHYESAET